MASQAVGTHNSYHVAPDDAIRKLLTRPTAKALLGTAASGQVPSVWEATQKPLQQQLDQFGAPTPALTIAFLGGGTMKDGRVWIAQFNHYAACRNIAARRDVDGGPSE